MPRLSFPSASSSSTDNLRGRGAVGLEEPAEVTVVANSSGSLTAATVGAKTEAGGHSRPQFLTFTRKILLSLMGIGVISAIVGSTMGTTRSAFTATVSNPGNTFAAGTLTMTNSIGSCSAVIAASCGALTFSGGTNLTAGASVTGSVTITNSGNLPATMTLDLRNMRTSGASVDLNQYLNLNIDDGYGSAYCVYGKGGPASGACQSIAALASQGSDSKFQNMAAVALPGGTAHDQARWAAGESHTFTFTVQVATGATTEYNSQVEVDLVWNAIQ